MLTTLQPGRTHRQWVFLLLLMVPIFAFMFLMGVLFGRFPSWQFHVTLAGGVILVIGSLVTVGLNWRVGLYLITFFVLWDRLLGIGPTGSLNATKLAIGLTAVFLLTAILNGQLPGWWRRLLDPLVLIGGAFILVSVSTLPFMPHPEIATDLLVRRANVILLVVLLLIAITDRDIFHRCLLFLVLGGALVGLATTSEAFTGVGLLERLGKADPEIGSGRNVLQTYRGSYRLIGPSGDPNFFSIAQAVPAVIAFGLLFYYKKWWKTALLVIALCIFSFNILGSGSRSGALAFVVGAGAVFVLCPVKHRAMKATVVAVIAALGITVLLALDTGVAMERITSPGEASEPIGHRVSLWQMSLDMWYDNPVLGAGTNSFAVEYQHYRVPGSQDRPLRPHNTYMQLLCENGIQGVVAYLLFFVAAFTAAVTAALGTKDVRLKFEAMALASLMVGFFVFAGTSNVLENELFFLVFGLCGASYNVYRREAAAAYRSPFGPLDPPAMSRAAF